tara:strand:+ start:9578 stop:11269 length:1692 start_codon:yes stop_codon:yes gene_type:complete
MYGQFFNIDESAFSIAPNPKYLFLSPQHQEAIAHLLYGITRPGGFVLITGDIGTGKTTVCRSLFSEIPDNTDIALIVNPKLNSDDLLASICDELDISYPEHQLSSKTYLNKLNERLIQSHAAGRNTILIVDEAQNLSVDALETIRVLTNLETDEQKLLQIILIGQPELKNRLATPEMEQLNQRITARFHLQPLTKQEVSAYIAHRLNVAGSDPDLFSKSNIGCIYNKTKGIPRLVNVLCDRSLLGAYVQKKKTVSNAIIKNAATQSLANYDNKFSLANASKTSAWIVLLLLFASTIWIVFYSDEFNNKYSGSSGELASQAEHNKIQHESYQASVEEEQNSSSEIEGKVIASLSARVEPLVIGEMKIEPKQIVLSPLEWANQKILESWGIDYSGIDENACEIASLNGLMCFSGKGDVALLQRLNRPVILKNKDDQQEVSYLFVKTVEQGDAIVLDQSGMYRISWLDIASSWSGEFELLWKPLTSRTLIKPGMNGEFVKDIDRYLSIIFNRSPEWNDITVYDSALVKEVKLFQRAQGIPADGVIGPLTQIYMNNLIDENVPRLRK